MKIRRGGEKNTAYLLNRRFGRVTPTPTPPALLTLLSSSNRSLSFIISPRSVVSSFTALEDRRVMDELEAWSSRSRMEPWRWGRLDEEDEDGGGVIVISDSV